MPGHAIAFSSPLFGGDDEVRQLCNSPRPIRSVFDHSTGCRRLPGLACSILYGRRVFAVAVEGARVTQRGSTLFDARHTQRGRMLFDARGHPCVVSLEGLTITLCPAENAQQAKKDAEHHRSTMWSNEEKYPLLGSAFYCKSRHEYELEAKQGPSGTFRCVCVYICVCACVLTR